MVLAATALATLAPSAARAGGCPQEPVLFPAADAVGVPVNTRISYVGEAASLTITATGGTAVPFKPVKDLEANTGLLVVAPDMPLTPNTIYTLSDGRSFTTGGLTDKAAPPLLAILSQRAAPAGGDCGDRTAVDLQLSLDGYKDDATTSADLMVAVDEGAGWFRPVRLGEGDDPWSVHYVAIRQLEARTVLRVAAVDLALHKGPVAHAIMNVEPPGCGCRTAPRASSAAAPVSLAAALALLLRRRRRR